ncbi:hypothetical protein V8D89_004348 [Ganoderma adspersum]
MPARPSGPRNDFSDKEDNFLAQYIAKYNPQREGRTGNKLYERLVENAEGKWPWHKRHTWQSWRERYRSHQDEFDRRIARHLRKASEKVATKSKGGWRSASPPPAPAPAPQSPPSEKRERVPYTMEDDDNLAEYLATNSLSHRGRQGKNLYEAIIDEPWGERHSWQSWHERYRKNHQYFDRRIKRIHANEDDGDESDFPRPRTVDGATRYSLSQARVHAKREKEKEREKVREKEREREKRKRTSRGDESGEAPPRKKTRVKQPVAGPLRRKDVEAVEVPDEPEIEVAAVPDGQEDEGPRGDEQQQPAAEHEAQDGEGGEEDEGKEGKDEPEEDDEDDEKDEDEEDQGPVGSDDYCGEIFDEPAAEAEVEGRDDGSESESDREQEEAELMLSDNPFPDAQDMHEALGEDADADVDMGGDETVVEEGDVQLQGQGGDEEENPFDDNDHFPHDIPMADDEAEQHLSTTPPSGASPPARAHNSRIEHDIDAQPDTPELSPAEDANARRRRDHGHEPAPARKHAKRILRNRGGDEDFFDTPSTSAVGTAQNSPTARHVARRTPRVEHGSEEDGGSPQKRQREPPHLDEGAWNTAFTDARGRTRASPKRPRRSGVDFEFEDAEAREARAGEGQGEEEDAVVDATPLQWPPVRGAAKGKGKAKEETVPATPARGARDKNKAREVAASPGEGRVVTTEHILSVKTIRTVERRPASGTGAAVEAAREPAQDQSSSPRTLVQEDGEEDSEVKAEPTQRHPFSQLEPRELRGASSSRGSSIFPLVGGGAKESRKDDIARMQKMLAASRGVAPEEKEKDKGKDGKRRILEDRKTFISRLANGGGPRSASELGSRSTRRRSPVSATEDVRRRGQRLARFQEREESLPVPESVPPLQSSPLARRGSNPAVDELIPHASTSRAAPGTPNALLTLRVDKGKAREDAPPSGAAGNHGHHPRQHTTNERESDFIPAPQDQSSVVRRKRHTPRQSFPVIPSFTLEEDPYVALSHMFHPPPSGSGLARVYTLPSRPSLPHSSSDPPLYASLPAHERVMVKELGIQCMLAAMARNHGFGLEIVRGVCEKAGSMEKTDRVLRDMRESANKQANASFREIFSESGGEEGEEDDEDGAPGEDGAVGEEEEDEESEGPEEADEDALAEDADVGDKEDLDLPDSSAEADEGDSAEVESVLGQDANSWMDDAPQAESSRIRGGAAGYGEDGMDVDVGVSHATSSSTRKPFRIKVLPKEPVPAVVYSPPKKTRASHFIKKVQKANLAQSPQRGQDAMQVDADPFSIAETRPAKPRYADIPVGSVGQLSKYGTKEWLDVENKYGPGAAKIMMGKALAKLLPDFRQ